LYREKLEFDSVEQAVVYAKRKHLSVDCSLADAFLLTAHDVHLYKVSEKGPTSEPTIETKELEEIGPNAVQALSYVKDLPMLSTLHSLKITGLETRNLICKLVRCFEANLLPKLRVFSMSNQPNSEAKELADLLRFLG
jgi:hypothetical protein